LRVSAGGMSAGRGPDGGAPPAPPQLSGQRNSAAAAAAVAVQRARGAGPRTAASFKCSSKSSAELRHHCQFGPSQR